MGHTVPMRRTRVPGPPPCEPRAALLTEREYEWNADAREVVLHYREKGLRGAELRRRVAKHVRLLTPLDQQFAEELAEQPLTA